MQERIKHAEIVEGLKQGDEKSFELFYEKFSSPLLNHLFQMLGSKEVAEDLLHDVFMLVIKKIQFYNARADLTDSFKSWVFRIATNRAIDEIRRRKKQGPETEEVRASEETMYIEAEVKDKLSEAIGRLPLVQRTFMSLKVHQDLSHKEIALICGCHINSVKQGLFRARQSLKAFLESEEEIL